MKKYLRRFKTEAEYQAFINDEENFLLPNVSYVEDTTTSYFNDKEEVIPAIIYAKYNATAENMVLSSFPENIKSLKIDGNSVEMVTPQKEVKTINVLAANVNYNPGNGEVDMPQEYLITNMPFSLNLNVANDTMASIEYNYIFAVMEEDGVMMSEAIDRDNWIDCGFTYNKDDNSITVGPMMFMEMSDNTSLSFILGNVDMEKGEATFFDTNIKMTTLTSNNLPSPYMFETEGIHDVEIELCDETSFGLMFAATCIQEVNIPGTVLSTSQMSFTQCNYLTSVTFNNGLKAINQYSLYYCPSLTTLVLPDTLEYIGVFGCAVTGLTELVLPNSVKEIGLYAFFHNPFTKVTLNEGLETIGEISFGECIFLTEITIPDTVTTIGNEAFRGCSNLVSVVAGSGITKIGKGAFEDCPHIEFNGNNASEDKRCIVIDGKLIYCNATDLTSYDIPNSITEIGDGVFYNCSKLTSITIPNSVTSIGSDAFKSCYGLTSIAIPNSVTEIGDYAFNYCSKLNTISIPNSVTSIGDYAFQYCYGLTSITIPNSVTTISDGAFNNCASITSFTIPNSVTSIGVEAFGGCESLTSITILNSVTSIGDFAFGGCASLTTITLPNSVTEIGDGAFEGCSKLTGFNGKFATDDKLALISNNRLIAFAPGSNVTTYTIPNSVTSIGEYAFYQCYGLASITIPNSVTTIGDYAFDGCSSLTSITIPNSVTEIGDHAFSDCQSLTSITIPNSITKISDLAFYQCYGLTSFTIPNSVTTIGDAAFQYCESLTSITIPNSVTEIGAGAFTNTSLTSVYIPDSVTTIGHQAFANCKDLTSVTIGNGITKIDDGVFDYCTSLAEINEGPVLIVNNKLIAFAPASNVSTYVIPNNVTYIGARAFYDCKSLTEITIPNGVTSIGNAAFNYCESLTSVYCKAIKPPVGQWGMFNNNASGRKIYVPMASVDAYKSADSWSDYSSAIEGYNF